MCIMMIKYRVHEVAKDLNVPNKEVLDILAKYVKEPKKHMTALEENELDIVFDKFTQDHAVKDFDAYFATRNQPKEAPAAEEEKPAAKPNGRQQEKKPQQAKPGEKKPGIPHGEDTGFPLRIRMIQKVRLPAVSRSFAGNAAHIYALVPVPFTAVQEMADMPGIRRTMGSFHICHLP